MSEIGLIKVVELFLNASNVLVPSWTTVLPSPSTVVNVALTS